MNDTRAELDKGLHELLHKIKVKKTVSTRDLSGAEIRLAQILVEMKLASVMPTRNATYYSYGVLDEKELKS
jgi:hypothetical protein